MLTSSYTQLGSRISSVIDNLSTPHVAEAIDISSLSDSTNQAPLMTADTLWSSSEMLPSWTNTNCSCKLWKMLDTSTRFYL